MYAMMESKTEASYTALLNRCKTLFPYLVPRKIMTDFEMALHNAIQAVYGDAKKNACWFHVQVCTFLFRYKLTF